MEIHNVEQRSPEWFELRRKYPLTASNAQAIGNQGEALETLCWKKLSERYSSAEPEEITGKDLVRGVELEPQARSIYELKTGNTVTEVGFVTNESISKLCGASPDGLICDHHGDDGNLEIKCHKDIKHFKMVVQYKKTGSFDIDSSYYWQVQMQMLVTGRKWTDFVAFNPNFKESILIKRIFPDQITQGKILMGLAMGEVIIKNIESNLEK